MKKIIALVLTALVLPVGMIACANTNSDGIAPEPSENASTTTNNDPSATVEDTEPVPTEPVVDEHGAPGLLYMVNEGGKTASFIGWGNCTEEKVYVASVYEGLPVTQMLFIEQIEQQKRIEQERLTNPDYREISITADDFSFPNIKHIVIPDSVEYVKAQVIAQCENLETLHIGAAVNDIDGSLYYNGDRGRNFSKITVSPQNEHYIEKGNCLIRVKDKVLLCGFANSIIPDDGSVEIIGTVAFFNKPGLTSVVVPEGVIRIMNMAFGENDELQNISLPKSIQTIHGWPFDETPSLTEFSFAGIVSRWNYIAKDSWINNTALRQVTCSDGIIELEFDQRGHLVK